MRGMSALLAVIGADCFEPIRRLTNDTEHHQHEPPEEQPFDVPPVDRTRIRIRHVRHEQDIIHLLLQRLGLPEGTSPAVRGERSHDPRDRPHEKSERGGRPVLVDVFPTDLDRTGAAGPGGRTIGP